jgi:probable HAF family extracellular repeat protein
VQHEEDIMEFRNRFVFPTTLILVVILATSQWLAAQDQMEEHSKKEHNHYRLIDLGTLGGPHSYGSVNGDGFQLLNNSGVVASYADTALPDPNAPNSCFDPGCFRAHAFRWKNGVVTDLGALAGNYNSAAGSINARGWAAGQSQTGLFDPILHGPGVHAVLWKKGQIVDLGSLSGNASLGIYVNDAGQVVGLSDNTTPDPFSMFGIGVQIRTFVWEDGILQDIGTLGGPDAVPGSSCSGQPRNVVVGLSYTSFTPNASTSVPTVDTFLWKDGKMIDLGNLGGTMAGFGPCANHRGQVINASTLPGDSVSHAFIWDDGVMTDLGTLGGDNSEAIWLNDAGEVVGSADLPGSHLHHAVFWEHRKIHDLGTVSGDPCSRGRGLNAHGQVVGGSSDCANFLRAFLWEEGGPMLDLNTLIPPESGFQLTNAFNINDRGEILAKAAPLGFTPNDDADLGHLVLLVPCDSGDADAGCDENDAATLNAAPQSSARMINSLPTTSPLTPRQQLAAWRARISRQLRIPVVEAPRHQ